MEPCKMGGPVIPAVRRCMGMVSYFLILRRFIRAIVGAWRRNVEFHSLAYLVLTILASGTIFYTSVEKWSVVDAFYFSVTTLTTVDLGDLAPTTILGKLFTVVYIFVGIGLIAAFITTLAKETFASERRRRDEGEGRESAPGS
jgi:voltage-gated potassium channel